MTVDKPEPDHRLAKHRRVLAHLADADTTTVGATASATGMTVHEARAILQALTGRGYAFERLGKESVYDEREVPRGRYTITPLGEIEARWPRRLVPRERPDLAG